MRGAGKHGASGYPESPWTRWTSLQSLRLGPECRGRGVVPLPSPLECCSAVCVLKWLLYQIGFTQVLITITVVWQRRPQNPSTYVPQGCLEPIFSTHRYTCWANMSEEFFMAEHNTVPGPCWPWGICRVETARYTQNHNGLMENLPMRIKYMKDSAVLSSNEPKISVFRLQEQVLLARHSSGCPPDFPNPQAPMWGTGAWWLYPHPHTLPSAYGSCSCWRHTWPVVYGTVYHCHKRGLWGKWGRSLKHSWNTWEQEWVSELLKLRLGGGLTHKSRS